MGARSFSLPERYFTRKLQVLEEFNVARGMKVKIESGKGVDMKWLRRVSWAPACAGLTA